MSTIKFWEKEANDVLLNKTIVEVRYLTDEEMEMMGWYKRPLSFILNDGTICFLSQDDEGNDGGVMFFQNDEHPNGVLPVIS